MTTKSLAPRIAAALLLAASMWAGAASTPPAAAPNPDLDKSICLGCHGTEGFTAPNGSGKPRSLHVHGEKFEKSVHGKRQCVECHQDISEIPHQAGVTHKVGCVQCHDDLWKQAQRDGTTRENARLGWVVDRINHYMGSIHARPSRQDQSRTNASCYSCHDAHYVYPEGSKERAEWRLKLPDTCGTCHTLQRDEYRTSVHGQENAKGNAAAAVCSDCHTTHDIQSPGEPTVRHAITKNCGNCHTESYKSYRETYHGQVHSLGYEYTAKCYDCHGSHGIRRVADPASRMHPDNRLSTCRTCHANATRGFISFQPHGNAHDFDKYPHIWITSKFMIQLLVGTFAFFWLHSALWFYREWKDRKQGKTRPHVSVEALPPAARGRHYERFNWIWRLAHLTFAVSLMILTLTGMTALYAESAWAPIVVKVLGGPQNAALVHRVFAVLFAFVFFAHLVWMAQHIAKKWRTFQWFGPNSLVPRIQDGKDAIAMFRWFFGKGPRPVFDRWTYWEKFDYWAPFWGVTIIGVSGFMMWFPSLTAAYLPGWVFNVAMIAHGEEAFLAAVFLFTVHFFNNHFRPDKFPLDVVMFTGSMPVEEFASEHAVEYQRLVETGQLDKYLVDAPTKPMTTASRILGFTLITFGLSLLVLVFTGFFS
ncbi:MAG TPA: cytochrome b/b6 domain-containing protein [Usitatibacter sp.]|nr:cytochrome b/b6 domain-containing protein [Usitatibacter sp.]